MTKETIREMSKSLNKYKAEIGKTCNTGALTTFVAAVVTPRVTGQSLKLFDYAVLAIIIVVFLVLGYFFLAEKTPAPKADGKWKRIKVKKDTTIHVMEETEG